MSILQSSLAALANRSACAQNCHLHQKCACTNTRGRLFGVNTHIVRIEFVLLEFGSERVKMLLQKSNYGVHSSPLAGISVAGYSGRPGLHKKAHRDGAKTLFSLLYPDDSSTLHISSMSQPARERSLFVKFDSIC